MADIPIIKAERIEGQCRFWCAFCKCFHYHSAESGHRVAHCHNRESPYDETGYVLDFQSD
jgi:hypothetical protein